MVARGLALPKPSILLTGCIFPPRGYDTFGCNNLALAHRLRYIFEDYVLDSDRRELRRRSDPVPMTPQVFDLLEYLIRNRGRVVSKDDLWASVWRGRIVSESALTTRINAVRSAVNDSGEQQRLVRTFPRKGIRFVGEVREEADEPKPDATQAGVLAASGSSPPPLEGSSIAVLPFTNMSDDPEQDYFADGIAEEIITALSRCRSLFVIARNSSFIYKGRAVDVRQIARELGVHYVLEGSVRRWADRLRFTGQLIDATTGLHIWADRFEGNRDDVFGLQDQITESVVAAIEPTLQLAEINRLKHKSPTNLDVYDLVLRAQQLQYQFTKESLAAALNHLNRALELAPDYAPAMAQAAFCYSERRDQGWADDLEAESKEGLRLAARAVELSKDDGNVFWMAAFAVLRLQMDARRAKDLAYRSLQLNPNSAVALSVTGRIEASLGNTDKALELLHRADRLSPRDPRGWFMTGGGTAYTYFQAGRYEDSVAAARSALIHNPRFTVALRNLAASLIRLDRRDEAVEAMRDLRSIEPQLTLRSLRARMLNVEEHLWRDYSDALRAAGLPE
jgi:TolB-like protein/tetratricopeptide (TPR) repeat protein